MKVARPVLRGPGLSNGLGLPDSYDLARLRRNELIERQPHSNTYTLTADGQRVALFYTKVHNRILRPLIAADKAPAPAPLRQALATIDRNVRSYIDNARLGNAA